MKQPELSAELKAICQTLGAVIQYTADNLDTIGPELRKRLHSTTVPMLTKPQEYILYQLLQVLDNNQAVLKVHNHDSNSTDTTNLPGS